MPTIRAIQNVAEGNRSHQTKLSSRIPIMSKKVCSPQGCVQKWGRVDSQSRSAFVHYASALAAH